MGWMKVVEFTRFEIALLSVTKGTKGKGEGKVKYIVVAGGQ